MRGGIILLLFFTLSFGSASAGPPAGIKAPNFSEMDIEGRLQSPANHAGQPLVIYFWASWCPACRRQAPALSKLYQEYSRKGVAFISVSLDQDLDRLKKFVKKERLPFPVLFDGLGWDNKVAQLYGVQGTPSYFLIDREGNILSSGAWSDELHFDLSRY